VRRLRSVIRERIGIVLESGGKLAEAEQNCSRALAITQGLAEESPNNAGTRRDLASGYARMAKLQALKGDFARSQENYDRSLALLQELASADPRNAYARRSLAQDYMMNGDSLARQGLKRKAEDMYRKALVILEASAKEDPKNTALHSQVEEIRRSLASLGKP
jgi:tetratricopeptide (TPR) repeat protein